MEAIKGKVSNIRRDVEVTGPDYSGDSYTSGSTTDVTNFVLGGRTMQFKSGRSTYDSIDEGDELIVAGTFRRSLFQVTAYRNQTKNLNSYQTKGPPVVRVMGIVVLVIGISFSAILFFIGNSAMPLLFSLPFLGAGVLLLYFDHKRSSAIKLIENYK